jgi:hypothetical protein
MAEITGVVQEIKTRSVSGGKTSYDLVVGGQAYGAGLYAPKCDVGDYVKFELDDSRGYKNVGRNTLKVSKNKPPAEAVAEAAATAPKKSTTGGSFDTRQDTISRQAAMNTAIQFMVLAASQEALGLPAAGAKGKRLETLEGMLHKYTQEFYETNTGVKWMNISPTTKDEAATEAAAPEEVAAPADSEWK